MSYALAAIAPVVIILMYIYYRDKWEKEPVRKLLLALLLGCVSTIPILGVEIGLAKFVHLVNLSQRLEALYTAFVVAGFTEEFFKYLAVLLILYRNKDFNEKYDAIVYAVFVSLGFAMIENFMYVYNHGMSVALLRAITAVPAHAMFGVAMGYHLSFAKFSLFYTKKHKIYALLVPIALHGIYDFILMSEESGYLIVFVFYLYFMYRNGLKKINELSEIRR
jgi:RsiW-degrading membrane proteinase PrsW (M82 family)